MCGENKIISLGIDRQSVSNGSVRTESDPHSLPVGSLQLHHQHPRRVHSEAGLPAPPAGQQGALGADPAPAAGTAAERGAQAAAAGREAETDRGAEGAAATAGGGSFNVFIDIFRMNRAVYVNK